MLAHRERLSSEEGRSIPLSLDTVDIELTYRCNYTCSYCYNPIVIKPFGNELTTEEVRVVLRQCGELQAKGITFIGGEPTLRKDLCCLIEFSKQLTEARARISSNGSLLDTAGIRLLKQSGLDEIQLSVHFEQFMRQANDIEDVAFSASRQAIQRVSEAVGEGIATSVNIVLSRTNLPYVIHAVRMILFSSQANRVTLSPIFLSGHATNLGMLPTQSDIQSIYGDLISLRDTYKERLQFFFDETYWAAGSQTCFTSPDLSDFLRPDKIVITPNGDVIPSHHLSQPGILERFRIGNVRKQDLTHIVEAYHDRASAFTTEGQVQLR